MKEKRNSYRHQVLPSSEYAFPDSDLDRAAYLRDISYGGCFLEMSLRNVKIGSRIKLKWTRPLFEIEAVGEIVRCEWSGDDPGVGIQFLNVSPNFRSFVKLIREDQLKIVAKRLLYAYGPNIPVSPNLF